MTKRPNTPSPTPKKPTKISRVLQRLTAGEILTVKDIFAMGINRPTDIIWKLRKRGINIISIDCTNAHTGEQFTKYSLA